MSDESNAAHLEECGKKYLRFILDENLSDHRYVCIDNRFLDKLRATGDEEIALLADVLARMVRENQ